MTTYNCKLQEAFKKLTDEPIYTFVKFPDGSYRAQSKDLVLTLDKVNGVWVGCTTEHEPEDVEISAKSLPMAKKRLKEWAQDYDTEYLD